MTPYMDDLVSAGLLAVTAGATAFVVYEVRELTSRQPAPVRR